MLGLVIFAVASCCLAACGRTASHTELGDELGVGQVAGLGRVLVDASGDTVYLYVPDRRGTSRCTGFCAVQWPPLLVTGPRPSGRLGRGVDPALVGVRRRPGGGWQATYDGWPLYTWHLDGSPGEATGQDDDMGLWQAVSPSGRPIR